MVVLTIDVAQAAQAARGAVVVAEEVPVVGVVEGTVGNEVVVVVMIVATRTEEAMTEAVAAATIVEVEVVVEEEDIEEEVVDGGGDSRACAVRLYLHYALCMKTTQLSMIPV